MSALKVIHSQAARVPLTMKDHQVLDEMFHDFDVEQIDQLEPYVKAVSVQLLDPREETAWIAGSGTLAHSSSESDLAVEMPVDPPAAPPPHSLACPCFTTHWIERTKASLLKSIER
jgi:hypothetical protein